MKENVLEFFLDFLMSSGIEELQNSVNLTVNLTYIQAVVPLHLDSRTAVSGGAEQHCSSRSLPAPSLPDVPMQLPSVWSHGAVMVLHPGSQGWT